jgi:NTE family protein
MGWFSKKPNTGLVLSGGAVRGFAHLGAIKALEEFKKPIDIISGTSAGALAGAFYLDGFSTHEILDIFTGKKLYELMSLSVPRSGFFRTDGLKKLMKKYLKAKNIEDLNKPMIIAATNFASGKIEYFEKGVLIDCLLASAGIPILFEVIKIDSVPYFDGGVIDNFPVEPLKNRCKNLIGVHVNPIGRYDSVKNPFQVAERAFHLAVASEVDRKRKLFDLFIEPHELINYGMFELKKAEKIYNIGYECVKNMLDKQ